MATGRNNTAFTVYGEISQEFLGGIVKDHGADWDRNMHVDASTPMAIAAAPGLAVFSFIMFLVAKIQQGA